LRGRGKSCKLVYRKKVELQTGVSEVTMTARPDRQGSPYGRMGRHSGGVDPDKYHYVKRCGSQHTTPANVPEPLSTSWQMASDKDDL
jgi:hypothetical protein